MRSKDEFNQDVINALTASCNIPFKIPVAEIERISKYAAEWFYRNYEDAVDNVYILIPFEQYSKDALFKMNRGITLPSCVYAVNGVTKNNQFGGTSALTNDFTLEKYVYGNYGLGGVGGSVEDSMYSDSVLAYVVYASWDDLMYHITKHPLTYDYNRLNNRMFIKGDVKDCPDLILDAMIKIPYEALYGLDLFYNYVLGESYKQLGNILGAFQMELPGNVTIDYSKWYDNGKEMVDEVKEEIKGLSSNSFFFTTNGS